LTKTNWCAKYLQVASQLKWELARSRMFKDKFIFQPAPSGFMIKREPKSRAFAANLQPERRP
jgi:hypothetical protein